jgi:hypothetical protein
MKSHKPSKEKSSLFIGFRPTHDVNRRIRAVAKHKGVSTSAVIMWALTAQLPKFESELAK